jgi:signal transduction histidine kinase
MDRHFFKRSTNLSTQIKRVITYRILICFLLALSVVLAIGVNDVHSSSHQLEKNLEEHCITLENFVISQILVKNESAIQPKLDDLNEKSRTSNITWREGSAVELQKKFNWHFPFSWSYIYPVKNIDGTKLGTLIVTGSLLNDHVLFSDLATKILLLLLFFIIIFIVLYPLGKRIPQQLFIAPINNLLLLLQNKKNEQTSDKLPSMPEEINEIKNKISALLTDAEERSHETALGRIATQVAHDIRSPLAVLNIETQSLLSIPEVSRINIRNAVQRVNDIANNLLSKYKQENKDSITKGVPSSELASVMLENIVSEKRVQILDREIQINLEIDPESYDVFVNVDIPDFKRVLSNIINNAIDAIDNHGIITVVSDNGCGIPKDKLPLIFEEGVSFGKKNGSGLGLPYAINKISSWHGDYSLTSEVGEGTEFEMILPQARPATWFAQEINIMENDTVVILDDDIYIHQIWDNRFTVEFINAHHLKVHHFQDPNIFFEFCQLHLPLKNTRFLLDYELIGHQKNGLILAKMLNIGVQSILVTSRYEDQDVREACRKLGMKIIPKPFAERTPINILSRTDTVFIDDEEAITSLWQESAMRAGKNINVFNDPREFMRISHLYEKDTLIYMDSSLGGNLKGEDFAKVLFDQGYLNIILATGFSKEHFREVNWVKDIIGKEPPWN